MEQIAPPEACPSAGVTGGVSKLIFPSLLRFVIKGRDLEMVRSTDARK
jgi:hypothetical protein